MKGQTLGAQRRCSGEVDFAVVNGDLTAEQKQACTDNQINLFTVNLGRQATVLISNAQILGLLDACSIGCGLGRGFG